MLDSNLLKPLHPNAISNKGEYRYLWKVLKAVLSHKLLLKTHQYLNYMPECTCILCNICI